MKTSKLLYYVLFRNFNIQNLGAKFFKTTIARKDVLSFGRRSNVITQSSSQRIESFKPDWRSDKIYGITTDPLIIPGSPFLRTLSGLRF